MTATNHALTGAVIALVLKKPELAIPLALLSHFVLDLIPHYNPSGSTRETFAGYAESWDRKMRHRTFRIIFSIDILLASVSCVLLPFITPNSVSAWTIFFSMIAAASPDFFGGFEYLADLFFSKRFENTWFTNFHISLQWIERPWGIYVELSVFFILIYVIHNLIK